MKIYQNIAKNEQNYKIFELFQHAIHLKNSIFHIDFNFKQKRYDLFEEKMKKIKIFQFFVKIDADHLSSNVHFSYRIRLNATPGFYFPFW